MKTNIILIYSVITIFSIAFQGCSKDFLDVLPEDKITSENFWKDEADVKFALNGIYSTLRDESFYGYGPRLEATTSNGYQWGGTDLTVIGNGSVTSGTGGFVEERWTSCYKLISRSNYFLENIDQVSLAADVKDIYIGEAHFLRGLAYSILAETYGGVPLILNVIGIDEARNIKRSSVEEVWDQVIADYDYAIERLDIVAPQLGRVTKGGALGMKMRAYLYQNKYNEVLDVVSQIEELNMYELFPSYQGLFQTENENNKEVLFDVQFIEGPNDLGNRFDRGIQPQNLANGVNGASRIAPIQNFVDAYEMIDGSPVDPKNPYVGRDPRLDFTILRPGAYFQGQLYPVEIKNHTGQRVGFLVRKYTIENMPITGGYGESPLNFIVLRYADVLLAKAEALIETNKSIDEAIVLINKIRRGRVDVKISALPLGLSQVEARERLRHERRIEFAFEAIYWADIKRWNIGPEIYPIEVRGADGSLLETKFAGGYTEKYNLLPIPDYELSLNPNLTQNPNW